MGELHSFMAYSTTTTTTGSGGGSFRGSSSSSSSSATSAALGGFGVDWDLQNLGVLNADMSLVMERQSPFFSSLESDFSTGYLEDALLEFSDRSKRRRLVLYSDDDRQSSKIPSHDLDKNCWNSNCDWDMSEYYSCMNQFHGVSDEPMSITMSNTSSEEANAVIEMKTPGEETSMTPETLDSTSSSYKKLAKAKSHFEKGTRTSADDNIRGNGGDDKMKKKVVTRVVYPFALVKPGGNEGDMTINDINERILMPPTRPLRHPVGDFACRPCVSADGPGLSGKAVVALTRIHTQGRGTITIIRTKG